LNETHDANINHLISRMKNKRSYQKDCKHRAVRNRFNKAMADAAEVISYRVFLESEERWKQIIATLQQSNGR
jgi:hypothetical protein